jgi:hypothetical protein
MEHTEGGFTSDIALDGALILCSKCPPVGSLIGIEVLVPSPSQSGEEIRIECLGRVARIADVSECRSFAVQGFFNDDHLTRQILK